MRTGTDFAIQSAELNITCNLHDVEDFAEKFHHLVNLILLTTASIREHFRVRIIITLLGAVDGCFGRRIVFIVR